MPPAQLVSAKPPLGVVHLLEDGVSAAPHGRGTNRHPAVPSRVFAPAGLVPTTAERELAAEWDRVPAAVRLERAGH